MKVAVLGFGVVGVGIWEMLGRAENLEQGPVLVRPGKKDAPWKVETIDEILADPSVDAVAEAMGGVEPAFTYGMQVLRAGKHFITANKALVAARGIELSALARERGLAFLFGAACGGALPYLQQLCLARSGDQVLRVSGILNSTTNYILDAMQRRNMEYCDALKDAQALGYAECDPTADVSGLDALRKIMLACAVAFDRLPTDGLCCEGIDRLTAADVTDFKRQGLTCRLVVSGEPMGDTVSAYAEPVLLPPDREECAVLDNFNLARFDAERMGRMALLGQGAGRYPTAGGVIRDLQWAVLGGRQMLSTACAKVTADNSRVRHRYYLRLPRALADRFTPEEYVLCGDTARIITEPVSVAEMHAAVQDMRASGADVFFAAMA